jgi:hypothetical protein
MRTSPPTLAPHDGALFCRPRAQLPVGALDDDERLPERMG